MNRFHSLKLSDCNIFKIQFGFPVFKYKQKKIRKKTQADLKNIQSGDILPEQCGCSTVAVHQLPKLSMRVRFPSPAPFIFNSLSTTYNTLKSIPKTRYQSVKFRFISTHGTLNQCFKCPISYHSQAEKSRGCCTATVLHPHDRTTISERLDEKGR